MKLVELDPGYSHLVYGLANVGQHLHVDLIVWLIKIIKESLSTENCTKK